MSDMRNYNAEYTHRGVRFGRLKRSARRRAFACILCGSLVIDYVAHAEFHASVKRATQKAQDALDESRWKTVTHRVAQDASS